MPKRTRPQGYFLNARLFIPANPSDTGEMMHVIETLRKIRLFLYDHAHVRGRMEEVFGTLPSGEELPAETLAITDADIEALNAELYASLPEDGFLGVEGVAPPGTEMPAIMRGPPPFPGRSRDAA